MAKPISSKICSTTPLKSFSQIEYSKHRRLNIMTTIAYQLKENKPQLNITNTEFNVIAVMACS
ncbi:hypothetical protein CKQ84_18835 [Shewanella sp. WE21]|nr:hypothetical protein CKQ84_18835 [Shewanella sp. WE21]